MDVQKIIKNYLRKVDAQNLSGKVSIISEYRFGKLLAKAVEQELNKLVGENKELQSEIDRLKGALEAQQGQPSTNTDELLSVILSKMDEMKTELKEEIQRQITISTTSSKLGMDAIDLPQFLDSLFREDLDTNIKVVKESKSKIDNTDNLKKLKKLRGED